MAPRNRWKLFLGGAGVLAFGALAVPVTAFVIVPQFVHSTLNEKAPAEPAAGRASPAGAPTGAPAPPAATGAPASQILSTGELKRINSVDYGRGTVLILQVGEQR